MIHSVVAVLALVTSVSFPVSTANASAQAAIDRGIFSYYAYNGDDAARAFGDAAALDPHLAMAYWGEALAAGPDLNTPMTEDRFDRGKTAVTQAVTLETYASPAERAFIDAMARRYAGSWNDWSADDAAYIAAMSAIAQAVPAAGAEPLAAMLTAEALMERGGLAWDAAAPSTPDARRALGIITQTLAADPADIMANHLCIHAYDQAPDRAPALHCAQALDDVRWPPQAEHLAHMPAHYWIETGDYSKALASSQRALDLIETLQTMPDQTVDREHYVKHDAYVGYSAAMMLGNYATAQMWAKRMDAAFGNSYDGVTALRFNRFDQAFDLASGSTPTDLAVRGYAAVALNRLDAARSAAAELNKATVKGYIGDLFLARLAEHDERFDEASRWIDTAIAEQHASLGGELIPLIPALEAPGGLALRRGRYAEAADDFRACLAAFPNDPRALFGLATALRASNQPQDPAMAAFDAEWNGADTALVPDDL